MKRIISLLLIVLMTTTLLKAQDTTTDNVNDTVPSAANIESLQFKSPDSATLKKIYDQLQKISDNNKQNSVVIHGLLQGKELDNMTKYQLLKNSIINATQTYYLLNKKIIDLKSRTTGNNLDVFIASLNNPESKELGFSFSERVIDLVKNVVLEGKANKNDRNQKIVESTNSIINSPIFKSFTALTPPLGIANAIMTFFHSVSINNKSINQDNLKKFEQELNK